MTEPTLDDVIHFMKGNLDRAVDGYFKQHYRLAIEALEEMKGREYQEEQRVNVFSSPGMRLHVGAYWKCDDCGFMSETCPPTERITSQISKFVCPKCGNKNKPLSDPHGF